MRVIVSILILCSISHFINGQNFPSEVWHEGKIVLIEGDTLKGYVKYNQETDIVQYTQLDNKITAQAFTGRKLLFFEIYDKGVGRYRQFYALPYTVKSDYKTPILFEVIYEGREMSILSREAIENFTANYTIVGSNYTRAILKHTYFFLAPDGAIVRYNGKKKNLLWQLKRKSTQIKKFIKSNNIRPDRRQDLVKTIRYYNSLFKAPETSLN